MHIENILNLPESIDIEYLKNNITEDQLLLLYWYITEHEDSFTKEQLLTIYEFLYEADDKLKDLEDEQDKTDTIHT